MSVCDVDQAWGQLVSVTDLISQPILISKAKFTIGRAKGCDLSFEDNKLVSGHHCHLEREDEQVWLVDTSTNGTLWNQSEKVKGEKKELSHGDEFYVVYKKNIESQNVGFIYQDLEELRKEQDDDTLDYSNSLEATLLDEDANEVEIHVPCRKRTQCDASDSPISEVKRQKTGENERKSLSGEREAVSGKKESKPHNSKEGNSDSREVTSSDPTENISADTLKNTEGPNKPPVEKNDEIAETLLCIICQEILHDCISLQPCLHSFCSGCYSDWMKRSKECPSCRMTVERVNRNHMVNNLVEAYLKEHPDKRRPEEDIKELDAKNKITRDMLYPKKDRHSYDSDHSGSHYDDDSDNSDDSLSANDITNDEYLAVYPGLEAGILFGLGAPVFGVTRPVRVLCRQCQGYVPPVKVTAKDKVTPGNKSATCSGEVTADAATADRPSTSGEQASTNQDTDDVKTMPFPPLFECVPTQNHVMCACCLQPMPDRRHVNATNPTIPAMTCVICYRNFCHAYWGCRKADCLGCFAKLGDMNFGKKCLTSLILDNPHESKIFADYLEASKISVKTVLKDCLVKLEGGEYVCHDQYRYHLNKDSWICYTCGIRNFKDLAYCYRRDIPKEKLPPEVTGRPDCYWGKNCRTQKSKPHHAQRFNHISDQSRTT